MSNVTPNIDVFFDNLQVTHIRGKLLEENHYHQFGLQMAGISDKALNKLSSQNKFNGGVELEEDYGVNLYSTFYRQYDPQLGRFGGVDIRSEEQGGYSPYHFGGNNPVTFNDPLGDMMTVSQGRMQKGPDGNYHVGWVNDILWNNIGFFDSPDDGGGGGGQANGGKNYTNIAGMSSANILSQMKFGDRFGRNKSGEYGFWSRFTFKPTDRGYNEEEASGNTLSEVSVGAGKVWVPMGQGISSRSFVFTKMTSAMYEAGVSGLFWELTVMRPFGQAPYVRTINFQPLYFGFPSSTKDGRKYNLKEAAVLAADAVNSGASALNFQLAFYSESTIRSLTDRQIQNMFTASVMTCMNVTIAAGGYVINRKCGVGTITTPAVWGRD